MIHFDFLISSAINLISKKTLVTRSFKLCTVRIIFIELWGTTYKD